MTPMRIYIIDGNKLIRTTTKTFTSELGHSVSSLDSNDKLLFTLDSDKVLPDLVITAPNHPLDYETIYNVHRKYPNICIVVMAKDKQELLPTAKAMSCGIFSYLYKPISFVELELLLIRISKDLMLHSPDGHSRSNQNFGFSQGK